MTNRIKLILIVLAGLVIVVWAVFSFKNTNEEKGQTEDAVPALTSSSTPTTTPDSDTSKGALIAICQNELKSGLEADQVKYENGSILVSFQDTVSLKEAEEVIVSNKLTYDKRDNLESDFETNRWLGVKVKDGEEIKWVCTLKEDPKVKNAIVNRIFELHE